MSENHFEIKTGVVGLGVMGQYHVKKLNKISNLLHVYDTNQELSTEISNLYDLEPTNSISEFFDNIEAVIIAVPTQYHLEVARVAADSKVHMLIEKPLASTLKECLEIKSFFSNSFVKVAIGQIERHNPVTLKLKELLGSGVYGELISINCKRCSPNPIRIKDVGVLNDLLIHDIDLVRFITNDEIDFVSGITDSEDIYEKHVISLLRTLKGVNIQCEASWLYPNRIRQTSILTTNSNLEVDFIQKTIKIFSTKDKNSVEIFDDIAGDSLENELFDFLSAINSERYPSCTLEDGLKAVEVISKIKESIVNNLDK